MGELVRDRLKTLQLGNIGTELSDASKNAYLNLSEREMKSAIAIGDLIQKTRTFNGATIPNAGAVVSEVLVDSTVTYIQPAVGESWNISIFRIDNLDPANVATFTLELWDGTTAIPLGYTSPLAIAASSVFQLGLVNQIEGVSSHIAMVALNLQLTNALYLRFHQTGAAPVQVSAAYTMDVI